MEEENEFNLNIESLESIFGEGTVIEQKPDKSEEEEGEEGKKETTVTDDGDDPPQEKVGNDNNEEPEVPSEEQEETPNITSSITSALVDEGLLATLNEERLSKIQSAEDLIEAFREDQENQLNERQKRIEEALNYGVEVSKIQQYEKTLTTLDSITDEMLEGEEEQNENYRKNLIYQNYLEKGFDQEEAMDLLNRSVESGKDIDDAKKALTSLKKIYKNSYDNEVSAAKKAHEESIKAQEKQIEDLRASIMNDEEFFKQFEINKTTRKKIFDSVTKAVPTTDGKRITALQKYIDDNPIDAYKKLGTIFVLTEGLTKFDALFKAGAKKEVKKKVEQLDNLLKHTQRMEDGSLKFQAGVKGDTSSGIDDDWINNLHFD